MHSENLLACVNDDECWPGFICGNCPASLGMNPNVSCCFSKNNCGSPSHYGDGSCNPKNYNVECNWDGGDCHAPLAICQHKGEFS